MLSLSLPRDQQGWTGRIRPLLWSLGLALIIGPGAWQLFLGRGVVAPAHSGVWASTDGLLPQTGVGPSTAILIERALGGRPADLPVVTVVTATDANPEPVSLAITMISAPRQHLNVTCPATPSVRPVPFPASPPPPRLLAIYYRQEPPAGRDVETLTPLFRYGVFDGITAWNSLCP